MREETFKLVKSPINSAPSLSLEAMNTNTRRNGHSNKLERGDLVVSGGRLRIGGARGWYGSGGAVLDQDLG